MNNDINTSILRKASGETRLNPDEQRLYMGTYRERVVLLLSFDELAKEQVSQDFNQICQKLVSNYQIKKKKNEETTEKFRGNLS